MSNETYPDLAVDTRQWGRWPIEKLFDYLEQYYREGYRKLPEKILITWEQRAYLLSLIDSYGQPRIVFEHWDARGNHAPSEEIHPELVIHTPFTDMRIEVVGYRSEHEA